MVTAGMLSSLTFYGTVTRREPVPGIGHLLLIGLIGVVLSVASSDLY